MRYAPFSCPAFSIEVVGGLLDLSPCVLDHLGGSILGTGVWCPSFSLLEVLMPPPSWCLCCVQPEVVTRVQEDLQKHLAATQGNGNAALTTEVLEDVVAFENYMVDPQGKPVTFSGTHPPTHPQ